MNASFFLKKWQEVPIVVIDVETTGTIPGRDRCVQVALARFERCEFVGAAASLINPGVKIPEEATRVHGITNKMVAKAPTIESWFSRAGKTMLDGAQPAAYNARFDRAFIPLQFLDDWCWPWLDPLSFIRVQDRYTRGSGRHRLKEACARRGIELKDAHDASADAKVTGELLYKILFEIPGLTKFTLGRLLAWQQHVEIDSWEDWHMWMASQPPKE